MVILINMDIITDLALEMAGFKDFESEKSNISPDILCTKVIKKGTKYITYECLANLLHNENAKDMLCNSLAKSINSLMKSEKSKKVMVVGLGNRGMIADALGAKVVDNIITAFSGSRIVSAYSPSVSAKTGLETYDIIKGISDRVKPDLIIVVDTLASRKTSRIASAYQLSNGGIRPGSGVGNTRMAIDKESMGIPVIAVGVPLVVYAKTLARDILSDYLNHPMANIPDNVAKSIEKSLENSPQDLVVTPKEIDIIVDIAVEVISRAINTALDVKTS